MIDFKSRWDGDVGLFLLPPEKRGHTLDSFGKMNLHALPDSVSFMIHAAQTGRLDEINVPRILAKIAECQYTDDEKRGSIKWYWEDGEKSDGNAPFFISVGLIPLRKYYSKELGEECVRLIDEIFSGVLNHYLKHFEAISCYYPNAFMGDVIFAWLINEILGGKENEHLLLNVLNEAGKYWIEENWGWGEHMSDGYSKVCCVESSMLLLMSEGLPDTTRRIYATALSQLLEIEELYAGEPRVPTIRSYAFEKTPKTLPYRQTIREWEPDEDVVISNLAQIGPLLNKLGWHDIAPPPVKPRREIEVPCFNGTKASAYVENDFRIGAVSRYPVMECCDYQPSGLSWQSFPVAFLHDDGDWGFLQWVTEEEDGAIFAHPSHKEKYDINKGLSTKINPPITGMTHSLRRGKNLLVLRKMPAIDRTWSRLSERLRVVSPNAKLADKRLSDNCSTLRFEWPRGRVLSVARVTFSAIPVHKKIVVTNDILDWDVEYGKSDIPDMTEALVLWAFSMDAEIVEPPLISIDSLRKRPFGNENKVFDLDWEVGDCRWRMKIDPASDKPFLGESE